MVTSSCVPVEGIAVSWQIFPGGTSLLTGYPHDLIKLSPFELIVNKIRYIERKSNRKVHNSLLSIGLHEVVDEVGV